MAIPGSAEDIRNRGWWAAYKDVTGLNEVPHQLVQGMRSIPGGLVWLAQAPDRAMAYFGGDPVSDAPIEAVNEFMGYEGSAETPFGQLAQFMGGAADVAIPAGILSAGRNVARNTLQDAVVDTGRRDFFTRGGGAAATAVLPGIVKKAGTAVNTQTVKQLDDVIQKAADQIDPDDLTSFYDNVNELLAPYIDEPLDMIGSLNQSNLPPEVYDRLVNEYMTMIGYLQDAL